MVSVGLKFGVVVHAKDLDDVPNVIQSHAGPRTLSRPAVLQVGCGWARIMFGDEACVYGSEDELHRWCPAAKRVDLKSCQVPPPMG